MLIRHVCGVPAAADPLTSRLLKDYLGLGVGEVRCSQRHDHVVLPHHGMPLSGAHGGPQCGPVLDDRDRVREVGTGRTSDGTEAAEDNTAHADGVLRAIVRDDVVFRVREDRLVPVV